MAALHESKANVNGADIDNDDLVQNHEDEARSLIRALVDATHFFKRKKAETLASSRSVARSCAGCRMTKGGSASTKLKRPRWRPKPYPSLEAVRNVFALALKRNPEIAEFNPLALRDLHYLCEFDDNGYNQSAGRVSTGGR